MKIPVTCEGCQRRYEADNGFAGKTVKCGNCGKLISIPFPAGGFSQDHDEYQLGDPHKPAPTTFLPSTERYKEPRAGGQGRSKTRKKPARRSTKRDRGSDDSRFVLSPAIIISLIAVAIMLALVAVFVPGARKTVGVALALPGLVLCLYGYASGIYIAFTEDDLYGWLCLLFPFYAAYYIVSRWDEMRSRLIMVGVGLTLLAVGGRFLEADLARAKSMTPEAAAEAP